MTDTYFYFSSPIKKVEAPEWVSDTSIAAEERFAKIEQDPDEIYPMFHTEDFANDQRVSKLCEFIAQQSWSMLKEQGYAMDNFATRIEALWAQKHYKHSLMEQHVHSGSQLVGFYFLDTPKNCSRPLFHDPRPGKVQNYLPEEDPSKATIASNIINFEPKPGTLILSNAWLPHSFTRHSSEEPVTFVHFNVGAIYAPTAPTAPITSEAEVV